LSIFIKNRIEHFVKYSLQEILIYIPSSLA
jgi:hypothetical protein